MAEHNQLGQQGEYEALLYLTQQGYTLHDKNWREGKLELDIVAEWWGEIVFVEVKTRRDERFSPAAEAVKLQKKRNLIEAARAYLFRHGWQFRPYRFDIITVVGQERPFRLTHIKDAYSEHSVRNEAQHRQADEFEV